VNVVLHKVLVSWMNTAMDVSLIKRGWNLQAPVEILRCLPKFVFEANFKV
jgi:hypothetical protein